MPLVPDGALLAHDGDASEPGSTEMALGTLADRLSMTQGAIHTALEQARSEDFQNSALYGRVFALAERTSGHPLAVATVPQINLQGPKITRSLTTAWYAHRVDDRLNRCLAR